MKRTTKTKWGDLKVGIILVFVTAVLFWASFTGGGTSIFDPKTNFRCYFHNVEGLVAGAPVWMSGVEVGNVKSVKFRNLDADRQVEVICRIRTSVWDMVTEDAEVQLGTIGFLGDKYIEVIPGKLGKPTIKEMSTVPTRDAGSATALFKAGEEAIEEARSITSNIDTLLGRMNRGEGTLGQLATNDTLYHDMTALMASLTKLTSSLQSNQERIISSIETTASSVKELSDQVSENRGTLGKIMTDPALYDNLSASTASLDSILQKINAAEGNLGLLVSDTALYSEFTNLLTRVSNLVSDIEQNPRKYFKFSVF